MSAGRMSDAELDPSSDHIRPSIAGRPSQFGLESGHGGKDTLHRSRRKRSSRKGSHVHRPKPWEDRSLQTDQSGNALRSKLPGIDAYDRELEYRARATPKIILRLERVIGTDRIRINDPRYMAMLSKKIEEAEREAWKQRVKKRQEAEHGRYRQLVIDGVLEPTADMLDLRSHPIFRVNRMMKRINRLSYTAADTITPPPIMAIEPFEEQKRTGYLFGWHRNHYLKVQSGYSSATPSYLEDADELESEASGTRSGKGSRLNSPVEEDEEGGSEMEMPKTNRAELLADYLRRESLSQARKYLEVDEDELKKKFDTERKKIIEAVFDDTREQSDDLFEYSSNVLMAYRREQLKAEDFCSDLHQRLFTKLN